jgi:putative transcriptional regulator
MTTIKHHPSDTTLAAFACSTLDEGRSLVVATHLAACAECRRAARVFEDLGGALLERTAPAALGPDALAHTLSTLDETPQRSAMPRAGAAPENHEFSGSLGNYRLGRWRRIGLHVFLRRVRVPDEAGTRVFLLKAAPGTTLPRHVHTGTELTCVLKGAFRHDHGRYGAGDVDDADDSVEHHPFVEPGEECICLVALQGEVRFNGFIGRMLQPFVRM